MASERQLEGGLGTAARRQRPRADSQPHAKLSKQAQHSTAGTAQQAQ
jgi:hypothetical protein